MKELHPKSNRWFATALEIAQGSDLGGRQIVITGPSSGIGVETVRALAMTGADLVLGARDPAKAQAALVDVRASGGGTMTVLPLDLADLATVDRFASQVSGAVDILIANAGISKTPDSHLANGLDVRFATNHLGHFHLACLLKPQMAQRGARLVVVSSAAHKAMPVRLDDLQWTKRQHFDGAAYAESKTANILFAQEATRRWACEGIFANAVLPGTALTGLQRFHGEALKRQIGFIREDGSIDAMVKTAGQAAATSLWAAIAPELAGRGGLVLEDCAAASPAGPDTHAWTGYDMSVADTATAHALWEHSLVLIERLVGGIEPVR